MIVDAIISDPEKIYIDLDTYENIEWPSENLKERGGLDGWPLWGWVGTLGGRRARIVHVWNNSERSSRRTGRKGPGGGGGGGGSGDKKECRHVGLCVKNCSDGVEGRTVVLIEVDDFFVPIQAEGLRPAPEGAERRARAAAGEDVWDEAEMRPSVGRCATAAR
jgi:ferredoxin